MAVGVHRFCPRKRKVILKVAWGYFREDWSFWGGRRVRATSLGGGCLSDFYYSLIFYALPLPRRFSVTNHAGPFSQGLQVCLVQLEERAPQGGRGARDLQAHQAPKENLGPKVGGWYVAGKGGRREG